jgi:hypothetical protein
MEEALERPRRVLELERPDPRSPPPLARQQAVVGEPANRLADGLARDPVGGYELVVGGKALVELLGREPSREVGVDLGPEGKGRRAVDGDVVMLYECTYNCARASGSEGVGSGARVRAQPLPLLVIEGTGLVALAVDLGARVEPAMGRERRNVERVVRRDLVNSVADQRPAGAPQSDGRCFSRLE